MDAIGYQKKLNQLLVAVSLNQTALSPKSLFLKNYSHSAECYGLGYCFAAKYEKNSALWIASIIAQFTGTLRIELVSMKKWPFHWNKPCVKALFGHS